MEFLYNWCFQMSGVVQELRATTQTLMDKVVLIEAMLAERPLPACRVKRKDAEPRRTVRDFHRRRSAHLSRPPGHRASNRAVPEVQESAECGQSLRGLFVSRYLSAECFRDENAKRSSPQRQRRL